MGNDYYVTNEHRVAADGSTRAAGEVFGYDDITRQYYDRYKLPVMHTETNLNEGPNGDEAVDWLWKQWANVLRVRNDGVPIVGFTWYSLTDQVDWDTALREENGRVNPLGLYDLDRNIRRVGQSLQAADPRLARGAAGAERLPGRARGAAERIRGWARHTEPAARARAPTAPGGRAAVRKLRAASSPQARRAGMKAAGLERSARSL